MQFSVLKFKSLKANVTIIMRTVTDSFRLHNRTGHMMEREELWRDAKYTSGLPWVKHYNVEELHEIIGKP